MTTLSEKNSSKVDLHLGHALIELAKTYPDLKLVLLESVQNALDSNARFIYVSVDYKKRTVTVRDNGDGVSKEEFEKSLVSICNTRKKGVDKLGRFGVGMISPINKCDQFFFTSTPKSDPCSYMCWTFDRKVMENEDVDSIPNEKVPKYIYGTNSTAPRGKEYVNWRTEVRLHNLITDAIVTKINLENLKEEIVGKFGEKMRQLNTTIKIKILRRGKEKKAEEDMFTAPDFEGSKLETVKYEGQKAGKITLDFYLARKMSKKGRNGKVFIGVLHDMFRMNFGSEAVCHLLSPEAVEVISSGIFEGTMRAEKVKLVKERTHFEKNETLEDFCKYIELWVKDYGKQYVKEIKDESKNELWQLTGVRSLKTIEDLLQLPEYKDLKDVFGLFKIGTVGHSHSGFAKGKKLTDLKELSTLYDDNGENGEPSSGSDKTPNKGESKSLNKESNKAQGPQGTKRKIVTKQGIGLELRYEEMSGKSVLWEFDLQTGSITFNVRHPLWERAERKERVLIRLQEYIIVAALTIETRPRDLRSAHQEFAQQQLEYIIPIVEVEHPFVRTVKT